MVVEEYLADRFGSAGDDVSIADNSTIATQLTYAGDIDGGDYGGGGDGGGDGGGGGGRMRGKIPLPMKSKLAANAAAATFAPQGSRPGVGAAAFATDKSPPFLPPPPPPPPSTAIATTVNAQQQQGRKPTMRQGQQSLHMQMHKQRQQQSAACPDQQRVRIRPVQPQGSGRGGYVDYQPSPTSGVMLASSSWEQQEQHDQQQQLEQLEDSQRQYGAVGRSGSSYAEQGHGHFSPEQHREGQQREGQPREEYYQHNTYSSNSSADSHYSDESPLPGRAEREFVDHALSDYAREMHSAEMQPHATQYQQPQQQPQQQHHHHQQQQHQPQHQQYHSEYSYSGHDGYSGTREQHGDYEYGHDSPRSSGGGSREDYGASHAASAGPLHGTAKEAAGAGAGASSYSFSALAEPTEEVDFESMTIFDIRNKYGNT